MSTAYFSVKLNLLLLKRLLNLKHLPPLFQEASGRRYMLKDQSMRNRPSKRHIFVDEQLHQSNNCKLNRIWSRNSA